MKNFMVMLLLCIAATVSAKDWKTVVFTTQPKMHCESCENRIKGNLRFEKGVKGIETNVAEQKVIVKYDEKKTNPETLRAAFGKFGYEATLWTDGGKGCKEGKGCQKEQKCKKASGCQKSEGCQEGKCCKGAHNCKAEPVQGNCCK